MINGNMHGLHSLSFVRSKSVIEIVNSSVVIIEGEQCYFSCENGEY